MINQVQKNAKDINGRLLVIEKCELFQRPPAKAGGILNEAKVRLDPVFSVFEIFCGRFC